MKEKIVTCFLALMISKPANAQDCAKLLPPLERAALSQPTSAEVMLNLGVNRFRCGLPALSLEPLQKAAHLAPDNSSAHFYLGVSLLALDRDEEAKSAFRKMASLTVGDTEQLYLLQKGYSKLATALLERIAESDPESPRLNQVRAELLTMENHPDQAIEEFQRAVRKSPDNAALRYALGSGYWGRFRASDAIPEFQAAIRIDPEHYMAHYKLGLAYLETEKITDSIVELSKALTLQPGLANGHIALAKAYLHNDKPDLALASVERGLAIDRGNESGQYLRAQILRKLGREKEADEQLARFREVRQKTKTKP